MSARAGTIHASAVLTGCRAVLIRGSSGAGKSRLVLELIQAARAGHLPFARLVGDDRVHIEAVGGRLLVRPAAALAGLVEVRGIGIVQFPYEPSAVVGLVLDFAGKSERLPGARQEQVELEGVRLPRLAVTHGEAALPALLALLVSSGSA